MFMHPKMLVLLLTVSPKIPALVAGCKAIVTSAELIRSMPDSPKMLMGLYLERKLIMAALLGKLSQEAKVGIWGLSVSKLLV